MDGHTSRWRDVRVLVTGCADFLGSAVARELLARGAVVAGWVADGPGGGGFGREQVARQFFPVRGRLGDAGRVRTTLAVHEVEAVFHLDRSDPRGEEAVYRAVGRYRPETPIVTARPAGELRLASDDFPFRLGVARFGEVFGPGGPAPAADGPRRDHVFVRDAVRAVLALADAVRAGGSRDVTFRSGWGLTGRELAGLVAAAGAGDRVDEPAPGPADNPFGWRPETPLAAALAETVAWHREFPGGPSSDTRPTRRAA